jgi:hypothetical protein
MELPITVEFDGCVPIHRFPAAHKGRPRGTTISGQDQRDQSDKRPAAGPVGMDGNSLSAPFIENICVQDTQPRNQKQRQTANRTARLTSGVTTVSRKIVVRLVTTKGSTMKKSYNLEMIGLSDYTIRTYLSLLRHHPINGSQLSKRSGIPRARIYDILRTLKARGFVFGGQQRNLCATAAR